MYLSKLLIIVIGCCLFSCVSKVLPPVPYGPVPTENQIRWHEMEYYGLVCFGLNTYTRQEWGYGDVDPSVFNPSNLDTDQWARVAKEAGMKGLILVAKHHDGFCLWPSKTTDYTVAATPWKEGKGDVLGDLAESCKKYGLKLGVYISPWDRNHAEYGRPGYLADFYEQWREALAYSDDIWEVWFDGANGGTGYYGGARESRSIDKGYYQFPGLAKLIKEKQPNTIFFGYIEGVTADVVRWGGTEEGTGSETNWSRFDDLTNPDFNLMRKGIKDGKYWMPVEGNTTILHPKKWYYNENSNPRTLKDFVDLYYTTIGQNATFNLGLSIGPDGLIPERDAKAMLAQKKQIDRELANNLAEGVDIIASNKRGKNYGVENVVDGSTDTYWASGDSIKNATLILDFGKSITFNRLLLQEYIRLGQRIHSFSLEIDTEEGWKEVITGTTVGYKRILRFDNVNTGKARISLETDAPCLTLSNLQIFNAPPLLAEPEMAYNKEGQVTITAPEDLTVYYALGEAPSDQAYQKYNSAIGLPEGGIVSAYTVHAESGNRSDKIMEVFGIAKKGWKVKNTYGDNPMNAIDGDPSTVWSSVFENDRPQHFIVELDKVIDISGFAYHPPALGADGIIFEYEFYTSMDGKNWGNPVHSGEFSNIENNPIAQVVRFNKPIKSKYIKLVSTSTIKNNNIVTIAEIDIFK